MWGPHPAAPAPHCSTAPTHRSPAAPLASVGTENTVVLKVAVNSSANLVAVSGMAGLFTLDLSSLAGPGGSMGARTSLPPACPHPCLPACPLHATHPPTAPLAPALAPVPPPALTRVEPAWPDGSRRAAYHDVKWNEGRSLLYAAGKDKVVDVFALA